MSHRNAILSLIVVGLVGPMQNLWAKQESSPPVASYEVEDVTFLPQNWGPQVRQQFYTTPQGSHLMPYDFALALETEESTGKDVQLFFNSDHMVNYGFIKQKTSEDNPIGLPVGFTKDGYTGGRPMLGMNCAACHVSNLSYKGQIFRVDGGQSIADFQGFVNGWDRALEKTLADPAKLKRFARRLGVTNRKDRDKVEGQLQSVLQERRTWREMNSSDVPYGAGRTDAFNVIFNQVLARDLKIPENAVTPDGPVNYPVIWGAPQHDQVQWNGLASNIRSPHGPLGRNFGQVLGVFGKTDLRKPFWKVTKGDSVAYCSSAKKDNLKALEEWIRDLRSPQWPEEILGSVTGDTQRGRQVFVQQCQKCHSDIDRNDPERKIYAKLFPAQWIGTDTTFLDIVAKRKARTGVLEGKKLGIISGRQLRKEEPAGLVLKHIVSGTILGSTKNITCEGMEADEFMTSVFKTAAITTKVKISTPSEAQLEQSDEQIMSNYVTEMGRLKARPLNGIWASAPYLHNGSVPSLRDLLEPQEARPVKFYVGCTEFDPVKVGVDCQDSQAPSKFEFDTETYSNSNAGHEFGTDLSPADKEALISYLKTL